MDEAQKLDFQASLLRVADKLEAQPRPERVHTYDAMIDKAFEYEGAERARMLHFNAHVATEMRERGVPLTVR